LRAVARKSGRVTEIGTLTQFDFVGRAKPRFLDTFVVVRAGGTLAVRCFIGAFRITA
jgi:hypothetical protein